MFVGLGTLVNALAVLAGAAVGTLAGDRIPERARGIVTDALGLVTLVIAADAIRSLADPALIAQVGTAAPLMIVLGSLVIGGLVGSALRLEDRLESLGGALQRWLTRGSPSAERARFVEGFVVASLLFCTGPLTILGSLNDGLGNGPDQLLLKSALDGFAAIAFAASFGWGVAASVLVVVVVQGSLTLVGLAVGDVLPAAQVAALSATGGVILIGLALRLLRVREIAVADLLPGLLVAPALVTALSFF